MNSLPRKHFYRRLIRAWNYVRFGWPTIALVALIALGGYFVMLETARDQDNAYTQSTRDFMRKSILEHSKDNAVIVADYSHWSDAYENITLKYNEDWMEDNLATDAVTAMSIFRPGTGIRFSHVKGKDAGLLKAIPSVVPMLTLQDFIPYTQKPIEENVAAPTTRLVTLNGTLFALALQPIRPYLNYTGPDPVAGAPIDYVIAIKSLDAEQIVEIGKSFPLSNPRIRVGDIPAPSDDNSISLEVQDDNAKTIAVISWDNLRPGTAAMKARLVPIYSALFAIMVLTIVVTQASVSARLRLFKEARVAAETANRVKSNFLASVSHELRTPLSGIIGYAEMIEEDARDAGNNVTARDARKVTNAAQHLLSVINDLLDHTKIEAGKMDLNPVRTDLRSILSSVVENLQHQVTKKNTKLTLACDPELGDAVLDGMRLKQCLFNLVSNAAKFTKDGTIVVSARPIEHAGTPFIRISVKDSGIGMSEATIAKLFKPFIQADEGIASTFGGTGLGLVITKALVEAMGGSVLVQSAIGEGSTFTILAPRGLVPEHANIDDAPTDSIAA